MLSIKAIRVRDFGPFKGDQTVSFPSEEGVTIVYGENMRGKTSLLNAIRFAFFGKVMGRGTREMPLHDIGNWEQAKATLEAAGFAEPGQGVRLAQEGEIAIGGRVPISTMGGLKARGHPVGATGVYQIVELVQQLQGQAGANQVQKAQIGMAQNIGGSGATVITHILAN